MVTLLWLTSLTLVTINTFTNRFTDLLTESFIVAAERSLNNNPAMSGDIARSLVPSLSLFCSVSAYSKPVPGN